MNATSANAEVRNAAQQWFARLMAQDCNDTERAAFERWRAASPANAAAFRQVEDVWQRSATMRDDPAIAAALQEALRPAAPPRKARRWWPALAAAASLLLTVTLLIRMYGSEDVPALRYATIIGEQRTIALEDGSKVVLDTASVLQVQLGERERRLTLEQGQADFHVRADTRRPFVVHAAGGSVTALGTQFQVRIDGDIGMVTLLEGQVRVAADAQDRWGQGQLAMLAAGERIAIEPMGKLGPVRRVSAPELASLRGWTEGSLVVKEWPLQMLLVEMNRYSDIKLRLSDPTLREVPISGVFKAGDQKSFAMSLEYGWPIRADRSADNEIVLRHK